MKEIVGFEFVHTLRELTSNAIVCENTHTESYDIKKRAKEVVEAASRICHSIGLATAAQEADEILADKDVLIKDLGRNLTHLTKTIERDSRKHQYLVVDPEYTKFYAGTDTTINLSSELSELRYDLKEARLCLALNRTTACVFHLCLAMEFATEKLRAKVGAVVKPTATMGDMATEIEKVVDGWKRVKPDEVIKAFQAAIWPLKSFVKGVRNQELHKRTLNEVYKQEEVRALYFAVKGFLDELTPLLKMSL